MAQTEPMFSQSQIRAAFWKTFHKQGEMFFDYLGTEEEAERSTEGAWGDFWENLRSSSLDKESPIT